MSLFAKIKKILVGMRLSSISNKILSDRFPKGRKFRMETRINGGAATVSFYSRLGSAVNEADRLM